MQSHAKKPLETVDVRPRLSAIVADQLDAVMNATLQSLGIICMAIGPAIPPLHSGQLERLFPQWRVLGAERRYGDVYLQPCSAATSRAGYDC